MEEPSVLFQARLTTFSARVSSFREDVTGLYLIHLSVDRPERKDDFPSREWEAFSGTVPAPPKKNPRPKAGEPLSPRTTAYEGDIKRYVLLKGSELVARLGEGSYTGGFEVCSR